MQKCYVVESGEFIMADTMFERRLLNFIDKLDDWEILKMLLGIVHLLDLLIIPATIGEFWMIVYLLIYGIRPLNNET